MPPGNMGTKLESIVRCAVEDQSVTKGRLSGRSALATR